MTCEAMSQERIDMLKHGVVPKVPVDPSRGDDVGPALLAIGPLLGPHAEDFLSPIIDALDGPERARATEIGVLHTLAWLAMTDPRG